MTIHRSHPTSAAATMHGDFVRLASSAGITLPAAPGLSARLGMIACGMIGTIKQEAGQYQFVPDSRSPSLIRQLGNLHLSPQAQVERVSVDHDHEKAILALQYLMQVSHIAREQARFMAGNSTSEVARGIMSALMDTAATSDLDRIVTELSAAGIQVVEKVAVEKKETRTMVLTNDPEAVRSGEIPHEAITFEAEPVVSSDIDFQVHDASRTREILLAPEALREIAAAPQPIATPEVPATAAAFLQRLGMGGTAFGNNALTAADVGLGEGMDDDNDPETPRM